MPELEEELYEIIEEEEETFTLDFGNKTITTKEEHVIIRKPTIDAELIVEDKKIECKDAEPIVPSFEQELTSLFINRLASKAIASLLSQHRQFGDEIDKALENKRMGQLNNLLEKDIDKILNQRRQELRSCYAGPIVRYERIPDWAKGYVKEYIATAVTQIDEYLMDSE